MEVTEVVVRLARRYWFVLAMSIALPTAIIGALVIHSPSTYTAHTRMMAAATVPQAQAQADAVVSEVQAIATSHDVIEEALGNAHLTRDADSVVKSVTVTGFGSSGLVDLSYTDASPELAAQIDTAIANVVIEKIAGIRTGLPNAVSDLDDLLAALTVRRAAVASAAGSSSNSGNTSIDRLITELTADRDRISQMAATTGVPVIVDVANKPPADARGLPAKLAIGVLLGLVLGLLIVGANETLRPGVSGAARVARLLEVPVLGLISSDPGHLADIGRRLRLTCRRASTQSIVIVRTDRAPVSPELIDRIKAATLRPAALVPSRGLGVDGFMAARDLDSATTQVITAPLLAEAAANTEAVSEVCAFEELSPRAEGDSIGLVVLAGRSTRLRAVDGVRDLLAATGWPLLGVIGDPRNRSGMS